MNGKRRFWLLGALALVLIAAAMAWAAAQPERVLIQDPAFTEFRKGPVNFSHQAHNQNYGVECQACHHVYQGGQNVWNPGDPVQKCSACHQVEYEAGMEKLQNAFHKTCKDCHEQVGGPRKKCQECHLESQ